MKPIRETNSNWSAPNTHKEKQCLMPSPSQYCLLVLHKLQGKNLFSCLYSAAGMTDYQTYPDFITLIYHTKISCFILIYMVQEVKHFSINFYVFLTVDNSSILHVQPLKVRRYFRYDSTYHLRTTYLLTIASQHFQHCTAHHTSNTRMVCC